MKEKITLLLITIIIITSLTACSHKKEITIQGIMKEEYGTRMTPWQLGVVNGYYLFDYKTKKPFDYQQYLNQEVIITGEPGSANISMKIPFINKIENITFNNSLYVKEIIMIKKD